MKVILHAGAHATDGGKLLRCLLRNADDLRARAVAVPGPSRYRQLLSGSLNALDKADPAPDARDILLENILSEDPDSFGRIILSHDHLFCVPKIALGSGRMYPRADERMRNAARLFETDQIELFIGIRNPATWLPAVYAETPHQSFDSFLNGTEPAYLRWSEVIERIQIALPDLPITVWCNEDTPLIWPEVMHEITAIDMRVLFKGGLDIIAQIMEREGVKRLRAYMAENQPTNEIQRRRVLAAFLDKYAIEDAVEQEINLPGWTAELVEELSASYEDDMLEIARIPGVNFITA